MNLEIQRRAVIIAIRRVDLTREDLNKPTAPVEPGEPASQLGPTAATNLLTALSDLRNTQNNFMSVWLNFYANEMRLARELRAQEMANKLPVKMSAVMSALMLPAMILLIVGPVAIRWMNTFG